MNSRVVGSAAEGKGVLSYSIGFDVDYGDGRRSRGWALLGAIFFLKALVLLPHVIVLYFLLLAGSVVAYVGYWAILLTGKLPAGFHEFLRNTLAWQARTFAWLAGNTDQYPPFTFAANEYPAQLTDATDDEERSRGWALSGVLFIVKAVVLIPHFVVLWFVYLAAMILAWVGYVAVLFTGKLPEGWHEFLVGTQRWTVRVSAWLWSLEDDYPPFRLSR